MAMLQLILILAAIISRASLIHAEDNLHIDSDRLVIQRGKNTAIFTGNVLICLENMKLYTQKAIFTFEDEKTRKIKLITFPEKIEAIKETKDGTSIIISDEAIYTAASMELFLKGHVIIEEKEEVIITEQMLYYGKLKNIVLKK